MARFKVATTIELPVAGFAQVSEVDVPPCASIETFGGNSSRTNANGAGPLECGFDGDAEAGLETDDFDVVGKTASDGLMNVWLADRRESDDG